MNALSMVNVFGANYYRFKVSNVQHYRGGEYGTIASVPLIHSYSPSLETVSPRLALSKESAPITVGATSYQVVRYLAVQCLNAAFVWDEANDFRPAVKPHYAIAPNNGNGTWYNQQCNTIIETHSGLGAVIKLPVHVHDQLVSPAYTVQSIKNELLQAQKDGVSKFYTSYVVDEKNARILVTQHCLLNEAAHEELCKLLDNTEHPSLESLASRRTAISAALTDFQQPLAFDAHPAKGRLFKNTVLLSPKALPTSFQAPQKHGETPRRNDAEKTTVFSEFGAAWLLACASSAAIVIGLLTLAICTAGVGIALAASAYGVAGLYGGGVVLGAGLTKLGLFCSKSSSDSDGESELIIDTPKV